MGQINIGLGRHAVPVQGTCGYSFDTQGKPVYIDALGIAHELYSDVTVDGVSANVLANIGVGLEADLPAASAGYTYVTSDTFKIYQGVGAGVYDISDLTAGQFVTDTYAVEHKTYQFIGTELMPVSGGGSTVTICDQSDVELAQPTENTKATSALRAWQGFVYWCTTTTFAGLSTSTKTVIGAINELKARFTVYENITTSQVIANKKVYFCDTTAGAITLTAPVVTDSDFNFGVFKTSGIETPDVTVIVTGGGLVGGETSQVIQGENEGFSAAADGTDYNIVQDNRGQVQAKLARSSGGITPIACTKNPDNTVNLGSGILNFAYATDLKKPVAKTYRFAGVSNLAVNNLNTCGTTSIFVDDQGNITQLTNTVTPETHWRNPVRVAIVLHTQGNGTVDAIFPYIMPAQNPAARISSFMTVVGCVKQGVGLTNSAGTLQLVTGSGIMYIAGVQTTSFPSSCDSSEIPARNPVSSISYYTRSSRIANKTLFDPANYNSTGTTIAAIPLNNNAVIHHVYCDILGNISVQYGQTVYASLNAAISAHLEGQDNFEENPIFNALAIKIGYIIATKACTNLSDIASAKIIGTDKFGSTGGGQASAAVVDLQRAYDNGTQPQILTSSAKGSLQFKDATGTVTNPIFEVLSSAGAVIMRVTGQVIEGIKGSMVAIVASTGYVSTNQQAYNDENAARVVKLESDETPAAIADTDNVRFKSGTGWFNRNLLSIYTFFVGKATPAQELSTLLDTDAIFGARGTDAKYWSFALFVQKMLGYLPKDAAYTAASWADVQAIVESATCPESVAIHLVADVQIGNLTTYAKNIVFGGRPLLVGANATVDIKGATAAASYKITFETGLNFQGTASTLTIGSNSSAQTFEIKIRDIVGYSTQTVITLLKTALTTATVLYNNATNTSFDVVSNITPTQSDMWYKATGEVIVYTNIVIGGTYAGPYIIANVPDNYYVDMIEITNVTLTSFSLIPKFETSTDIYTAVADSYQNTVGKAKYLYSNKPAQVGLGSVDNTKTLGTYVLNSYGTIRRLVLTDYIGGWINSTVKVKVVLKENK